MCSVGQYPSGVSTLGVEGGPLLECLQQNVSRRHHGIHPSSLPTPKVLNTFLVQVDLS